jgi:GntR family transcriptional regulator, transcriptional repressor for pyruvate dehydrogenase complex
MTGEKLLERIERTSVITAVMDRIRGLIESGQLAPGARLPSERELRERLGVGRSTVREALRALEALGLIEMHQGRGSYVRVPVDGESLPVALTLASRPAWAGLDRVVEARLPIETYTASLAAIRRTDEQLAGLARKLHDFTAAMGENDLSQLVLADYGFHDLIAHAASPALARALDSISVLIINSRNLSLSREERLPHVLEKHRRIYEAIAAQDPMKASQAMSEHLLDFISELGFEVATVKRGSTPALWDELHYIAEGKLAVNPPPLTAQSHLTPQGQPPDGPSAVMSTRQYLEETWKKGSFSR